MSPLPRQGTASPHHNRSRRPTPLPDRLSVNSRSTHHVAAVLEREIVVRFNGKERHDVEEYCISERRIRVPAGRTLDRNGNPLMIKLRGQGEVFYR